LIFTKSNYILGLDCLKSIWEQEHKPHLKSKLNPYQEIIINDGNDVGELAKKLYPKGIDLSKLNTVEAEKETERLLSLPEVVIFEACFSTVFKGKKCLIRTDILEKKDNKITVFEVKSNGKPKDSHFHDIAFQKWVTDQKNIHIDFKLKHINKKYTKGDSLSELFLDKSLDITKEYNLILLSVSKNFSKKAYFLTIFIY